MSDEEPYCGSTIHEIGSFYKKNIHVYIIIPIYLVGMILNALNILVFTRKTMNSPSYLILAHLAFVDFLVSLISTVRFWMAYMSNSVHITQSYGWTLVYLYSRIAIFTFQFISAFLTVQLAVCRYIAVVHPLKERYWCCEKITRNVVITGYVVCCIVSAIPYHLSFDIDEINRNGKTYYKAIFERHPMINFIRRIIYGLVIKLLPSVVLVGLTSRIVVTLTARKTRREQLTSSANIQTNKQNTEMRQQTNRSTAILMAVAGLFFIGEFPRAILWLLRMIDEDDWYECYYSWTQISITILNIHTSISFMAYYFLSQQFRTTFKSLFSSNPLTRISHQTHAPSALGDNEENESRWETSEV